MALISYDGTLQGQPGIGPGSGGEHLVDYFEVADEAARLGLSFGTSTGEVQRGDVVKQTDTGVLYRLTASDPSLASSWLPESEIGPIMSIKGSWDASSGSFPSDPDVGDTYEVSVEGSVGGVLYKLKDAIVWSGTQWIHIQNVFTSGPTSINFPSITDSDFQTNAVAEDMAIIQDTSAGPVYLKWKDGDGDVHSVQMGAE